MCFGPSSGEKRAAAEQRKEATLAKQEAAKERASDKRSDISDALSARSERRGMGGGLAGSRPELGRKHRRIPYRTPAAG